MINSGHILDMPKYVVLNDVLPTLTQYSCYYLYSLMCQCRVSILMAGVSAFADLF